MKHLAFAILMGTLLISACNQKDACEDVNCNNGVCVSGDCLCDSGYEGLNCEIEQRSAFVADYNVSESCDLGDFTYVINVAADSENGTELTIHNLGDFDFDVAATVNGTSFIISDQTGNGATVNGTGTLTNGILTITYTMETTGGQTLNCTMTCTPL
ncbi:MAG: hypothetical protein RL266_1581 [Bacteroidota bacterium]